MPVDSKVVDPAALGAGAQVRRARHRALEEGRSPTARRCRPRRRRCPVELDEVFNMFDEPTRDARRRRNLQGFGDAFAGRGADLNQTIAGRARALRPPRRRSWPNLVRPAHRAALLLQGASADTARIGRAGLEDQRAPVHHDGQHLRRHLARPAGAASDTISKSPPTLRRRHRVAARPAPVPRAHRGALARPRRGATDRAAPATLPIRQLRAAHRHPVQAALGRSSTTTAAGRARRRCEDLVETPTTVGSLRGLHGHRRHAAAAAALPGPVRDGLQHLEPASGPSPPSTSRRPTTPAPRERALLNMADAGSPGPTRIGSPGRQRVRPRQGRAARQRRAVRAQQRLRPGRRRATATPTAARARPATSRPTTRCATRASRATPTRAPSTERFPIDAGACGPDLRAVRPRGQGRRPEPRRTCPAGETFTDRPGGHGVDIARPQAMRRKQRKGMPPFAAGLLTLVRARAS